MRPVALAVENLSIGIPMERENHILVSDVNFSVEQGEILAIVGESGSGKSLTARAVIGLLDSPLKRLSGSVSLNEKDLCKLSERELSRQVRGREIGMVFQDPMTALNPVVRIGDHLIESIDAHRDVEKSDAFKLSVEALRSVGISEPEERMRSYPHQLSGGMRQRVAIAAAMINRPSLLIADEPTTALDVTTQAQITRQISELRSKTETSVIWISHDLALVAGFADRVVVMYCGEVVETGPTERVLSQPVHPYTRMLLDALPKGPRSDHALPKDLGQAMEASLRGTGCNFRNRCPKRQAVCEASPELTAVGTNGSARCFMTNDTAAPDGG